MVNIPYMDPMGNATLGVGFPVSISRIHKANKNHGTCQVW